jgi:hypothetical protein
MDIRMRMCIYCKLYIIDSVNTIYTSEDTIIGVQFHQNTHAYI